MPLAQDDLDQITRHIKEIFPALLAEHHTVIELKIRSTDILTTSSTGSGWGQPGTWT